MRRTELKAANLCEAAEERECAGDVVVVVFQRLGHALSDGLEACKVDACGGSSFLHHSSQACLVAEVNLRSARAPPFQQPRGTPSSPPCTYLVPGDHVRLARELSHAPERLPTARRFQALSPLAGPSVPLTDCPARWTPTCCSRGCPPRHTCSLRPRVRALYGTR